MKPFLWCLSLIAMTTSALSAEFSYRHNGSLMTVRTDGPGVEIRYAEPRTGLSAVGVKAGTVLFNGKVSDGYLDGMANLFNRRCGTIDYFVYGDFTPGRDFTLTGAAPVRDKQTCDIVDNSDTAEGGRLVFTALAVDRASTGNGACVTASDGLNLRTGPGADFAVLSIITGCGVTVSRNACRGARCPVTQGDAIGWVNVEFLN